MHRDAYMVSLSAAGLSAGPQLPARGAASSRSGQQQRDILWCTLPGARSAPGWVNEDVAFDVQARGEGVFASDV